MSFADLLAAADGALLGVLGVPVRYQPPFAPAADVEGVFDLEHRRAPDAYLPGVADVGPAVFLRLSDLPDAPVVGGTTVVIGGTTYAVREAQEDHQGGVLLHLLAT